MSRTLKPVSFLRVKATWLSVKRISTSPLSPSRRESSLTALVGTMNSPWLPSPMSASSSTKARRRPSVATMVSLWSLSDRKTPLRT